MQPRKRSNFTGLRSQNGLSLVEVMVALALLGVVTLAAYTVGRTTIVSTNRVSKNIVDALNTDISVRGLNYQISNSEIMRKNIGSGPAVTCTDKTLLSATAFQNKQTITGLGDGFSFVYSSRRLVGATSVDHTSSIVVPDTQPFYIGAIVLLTSLDSAKMQSLYAVQSIDDSSLTLTLSSALPSPPGEMGCVLNTGGSDNTILNQLTLRKFSVDILAFVHYAVESDPNIKSQNRLVAKVWPLRNFMSNKDSSQTDVVHSTPVVDNFLQMEIEEVFKVTTATKGDYTAAFRIHYNQSSVASATTRDRLLDVKSGYRLTGVEVINNEAVPEPPSVEKTYVTCTVIATAIPNTFIRQGHPDEFSTIYRIETLYSEADTLNGGNAPAITANVTPNSPGGDPVQCWRASDITYLNPSQQIGPVLTGAGLGSSFSFEKASGGVSAVEVSLNSLVKPVFCYVPVDAQMGANLKFVTVTPDGYLPQNVTCSTADIKGSPTAWTYDGEPSKCSSDGSLFIGKLVNAGDQSQVGPQLNPSECRWDGSSSRSCNAAVVLATSGSAELKKVIFKPANLTIDGANGSELNCD